jgi:hypothetical protein
MVQSFELHFEIKLGFNSFNQSNTALPLKKLGTSDVLSKCTDPTALQPSLSQN